MSNNTKKRNTLKHFFMFLGRGDYKEILRILRRRVLNTLRTVKLAFYKLIGFYYYNPAVEKARHKRQLKRLLKHKFGWSTGQWTVADLRVAIIAREGDTYPKSSAFIRLISPLTDLSLHNKLALRLFPENTRNIPKNTDVCIVQRNAFDSKKSASRFVKNLRANQTRLVIDSDDAFHNIDAAHPEHDAHRATLEAFDYLVRQADQLWLSTERLAKYFKPINKNSVVVANSLDKRLWHQPKRHGIRRTKNKPLQLLYMGTVSHSSDFQMIFNALESVAKKYPGSFELVVIGVADTLPDRAWIKRLYQKRGGSLYPRFVPWLAKQGPFDIGLSPLVDSDFNRGKSDIKCLDYIAIGAMPIVSDIEPYQVPGIQKYITKVQNSPGDWEKTLSGIVSDPDSFRVKHAKNQEAAQRYLWDQRNSSTVAQNIYKLLQALVKH